MKTIENHNTSFNIGDIVWADDIRDIYMYLAIVKQEVQIGNEMYYMVYFFDSNTAPLFCKTARRAVRQPTLKSCTGRQSGGQSGLSSARPRRLQG